MDFISQKIEEYRERQGHNLLKIDSHKHAAKVDECWLSSALEEAIEYGYEKGLKDGIKGVDYTAGC